MSPKLHGPVPGPGHGHHQPRRPHGSPNGRNGTSAPAAKSAGGAPAASGRRKVVLVLEDYASVGGLIAALVRQEGYRAVRAWDPDEAIRLARGRQPDAIVLDFNVSPADGQQVARTLRANDATRVPPLLLVAPAPVLAGLADEERALLSGVVAKPFHIDIMLNAVRKAVGDPEVEVHVRQYDAQDSFLHGY